MSQNKENNSNNSLVFDRWPQTIKFFNDQKAKKAQRPEGQKAKKGQKAQNAVQ